MGQETFFSPRKEGEIRSGDDDAMQQNDAIEIFRRNEHFELRNCVFVPSLLIIGHIPPTFPFEFQTFLRMSWPGKGWGVTQLITLFIGRGGGKSSTFF